MTYRNRWIGQVDNKERYCRRFQFGYSARGQHHEIRDRRICDIQLAAVDPAATSSSGLAAVVGAAALAADAAVPPRDKHTRDNNFANDFVPHGFDVQRSLPRGLSHERFLESVATPQAI